MRGVNNKNMGRIEDARSSVHMRRSARGNQNTLHFIEGRESTVFGKPNSKGEKANRRRGKQETIIEDLKYGNMSLHRQHMGLALDSLFEATTDPETVEFVIDNEHRLEDYGYIVDRFELSISGAKETEEIVVFEDSSPGSSRVA